MKCDDRLLVQLLVAEVADTVVEDPTATDHLTTCVRCQQRLAELAADHNSWTAMGALYGNPLPNHQRRHG